VSVSAASPGEVGHSEHQVHRAEVVHPVGREVGGRLAVGLSLATLMLAHRARATAAGRHASIKGCMLAYASTAHPYVHGMEYYFTESVIIYSEMLSH
jgi:hypothetical protein